MNFFSRHKNTVVLATVLLAQLLALAVQVKRQTAEGPVRLIRLLTVSTIAPFERLFIYSGERHPRSLGRTTSICATCGARICA